MRRVFPTCVGVFPLYFTPLYFLQSLPHVRGGVSIKVGGTSLGKRSSPRAWGCFYGKAVAWMLADVFPTCVGVFLSPHAIRRPRHGLPHVRGGVSKDGVIQVGAYPVFPTCVGVFPGWRVDRCAHPRLPHVRGGVSWYLPLRRYRGRSSPRAWGCF